MNIELSFIIPVYNVEEYLEECVQSILCQIEPTCEIILVDDGSTDGSGRICDLLASDHLEIKVIHKENGGLSSARNAGMQVASGQYVAFVDSDDRIAANAMVPILNWIRTCGADMCFMDAIKFFPNGNTQPMGDELRSDGIRGKQKDEVARYLSTRPKFPGSACTKIFRKQFLIENNIQFPKDRRQSEDLGYVLKCMVFAEKYDALSIPYYEYRQNRNGSITYKPTQKAYEDLIRFVYEATNELTDGRKPVDMFAEHMMAFVAYEYAILVRRFCRMEHDVRVKAHRFLEEYRWVMNFGKTKRLVVIRWLYSIIGVYFTSLLLELYMNCKNRRNSR